MESKTMVFFTKTVTAIKCTHCSKEWVPRYQDKLPSVCPGCFSRNYMRPRQRKAHTKTRRATITQKNN